jgi:hypothetical protein
MQETLCTLANSTNLSLSCQWKLDVFPVNLSKPTRILYGRSVDWSTVEADVTYINKCIKEL